MEGSQLAAGMDIPPELKEYIGTPVWEAFKKWEYLRLHDMQIALLNAARKDDMLPCRYAAGQYDRITKSIAEMTRCEELSHGKRKQSQTSGEGDDQD